MTKKRIMYFVIVRKWWSVINRFDILQITSETPKKLYGSRPGGGMGTNVSPRDVHGKFDTLEAAQFKLNGITEIWDRFATQIETKENEISGLINNRNAEIEKLVKE